VCDSTGLNDYGLLILATLGVYIQGSFFLLSDRSRTDAIFDKRYEIFEEVSKLRKEFMKLKEANPVEEDDIETDIDSIAAKAEYFFPPEVIEHILSLKYSVDRLHPTLTRVVPPHGKYSDFARPFLNCMRYEPIKWLKFWSWWNKKAPSKFEIGSNEEIESRLSGQKKRDERRAKDDPDNNAYIIGPHENIIVKKRKGIGMWFRSVKGDAELYFSRLPKEEKKRKEDDKGKK